MTDSQLSMVDIDYINNSISGFGNIEDVIAQTTEILSNILKQPTISNMNENDVLESVKIINVTDKMLLVVLIGQKGRVKDCIVKLHEGLTDDILKDVNDTFNNNLKGVPFDEIKSVVQSYIKTQLYAYSEILSYIIEAVTADMDMGKKIAKDNIDYMLALPEFSDINNFKRFINILSTERIFEYVKDYSEDNDLKVIIGSENAKKILEDYSIVTMNLRLGDNVPIASIGVIGPKRMDFAKVVSTMKYLGEKIKKVLNVPEEEKDVKNESKE